MESKIREFLKELVTVSKTFPYQVGGAFVAGFIVGAILL